jgi:hypothetical protein
MKTNTSLIKKRTICSLIFGVCLFLAGVPDASAHDSGYRPYVAHDDYVYGRTRSFPAWLKRNREFRHWYLHSRYRFTRHMVWHRIYDLYLFERRYHRNHRRYYSDVYRDHDYRRHQKKWKKRKY